MKILFFFLILLPSSGLFGQTNPISSVNIRVSEEQDMVTITYDLMRNSKIPFYDIKVSLKLGGKEINNPVGLSGDLGPQVTAGLGKKILWDTRQDITALEGELKVDILTTTGIEGSVGAPCTPIKTVPVIAGLGGVAVTGLGLLVSGLGQLGNGNDLYDIYSKNTDPDNSVYASLTRDEHYQEANSKHKQGTWLTLAGGGILLAGGAVFINRLMKVNAYNRDCANRGRVGYNAPKIRLDPVTSSGPGIALVYEF